MSITDGMNDRKNTHINFEFELEMLALIQRRMAKKLSMSRELGDCYEYHAALGLIEQGTIAIREKWKTQFGEYPARHL